MAALHHFSARLAFALPRVIKEVPADELEALRQLQRYLGARLRTSFSLEESKLQVSCCSYPTHALQATAFEHAEASVQSSRDEGVCGELFGGDLGVQVSSEVKEPEDLEVDTQFDAALAHDSDGHECSPAAADMTYSKEFRECQRLMLS